MSEGLLTPPIGPGDHYLGPADAAIVLVEYGDFQCRRCGRAYRMLQEVLPRLDDRVRFVFRHFPIPDIHRHARLAAETAESAAAHGGRRAFWDVHDLLFENQDALEIDDLLGYADAAGVEIDAVADDLATGRWRPRVRADIDSGLRSGVHSTPAFFVNGTRFTGDWTEPAAFTAVLREAACSNYH